MMAYIPDEWFHDKKNRKTVSRLFADIPDTDILYAGSDPCQSVEKKLAELGEETILKRYREGYFIAG